MMLYRKRPPSHPTAKINVFVLKRFGFSVFLRFLSFFRCAYYAHLIVLTNLLFLFNLNQNNKRNGAHKINFMLFFQGLFLKKPLINLVIKIKTVFVFLFTPAGNLV